MKKFLSYDLGHRAAGDKVTINLRGSAANVMLLDSTNFAAYRNGRRHSGHGGRATASPVRLQVPRDGSWHVVIELGGRAGQVEATVNVA